jgi:hypothetical protein
MDMIGDVFEYIVFLKGERKIVRKVMMHLLRLANFCFLLTQCYVYNQLVIGLQISFCIHEIIGLLCHSHTR